MPLERAQGPGGAVTTSGRVTLRRNITATGNTQPVEVIGLPNLFFWFRQIAGAVPSTVTLQFTVANITGATPAIEWLNIVQPFVIAPGGPTTLLNFTIPCRAIRTQITVGGVGTNIQMVVGASS